MEIFIVAHPTRPETDQRRAKLPLRSSKVIDIHERMLRGSAASVHRDSLGSPRPCPGGGRGPAGPAPARHQHVLAFAPSVARTGRGRAVDRRRSAGLRVERSCRVPRERFRDAAVEFVDEVLDELGLERSALAGGSMGATWALWYALARPERVRRLALLGQPRYYRAPGLRCRCE